MVVHGEGGIAQARPGGGDLLGVVGEAGPLVADQHAGTFFRTGVVDRELADHPHAVGTVFDILDAHYYFLPITADSSGVRLTRQRVAATSRLP